MSSPEVMHKIESLIDRYVGLSLCLKSSVQSGEIHMLNVLLDAREEAINDISRSSATLTVEQWSRLQAAESDVTRCMEESLTNIGVQIRGLSRSDRVARAYRS